MEAVIGIDVSKDALDVCLLSEGGRAANARFSNDEAGFQDLLAWARGPGAFRGRFAMESTGAYHKALVRFLRLSGAEALVLNPRRCRDLAKGLGILDKDDPLDARVVALAVSMSRPASQRAEPETKEELREVSRRIEQLKNELAKERTRLREPRLSLLVSESLRRSIGFLLAEIEDLEKLWLKVLERDEALENAYRLVLTVPQIGPKTARVLVSELPDAAKVDGARRACGLAGLVPKRRRSGTSLRAPDRLSPCCNRRLKKAVYMPAVQALRRSAELRDFYARLINNGKHPSQALAAVMRKILLRALQVLERGTPWEKRPLTT